MRLAHSHSRVLLALAVSLLSLASLPSWCLGRPSSSSASWPQLGGSSANLGRSPSAVYTAGGSASVLYESLINGQQCEQSPVFLGPPRNSFWFACWAYDAAGNQNTSVFEVAAVDGTIRNQLLLTDFAQASAGAQVSVPAIYSPTASDSDSAAAAAVSPVVFIQTNIELTAFTVAADGVAPPRRATLPMRNTSICGPSLTIDQTAGVVFVNSNYDVLAFDIASFTGESAPMWTYTFTNAHPPPLDVCTTSGTAVDADQQLLVYTITCNGWGQQLVALDSHTGVQLWTQFWPITMANPIASTPTLVGPHVYVSLSPYGLAVVQAATGAIVTNGTYALTSASGTPPSYWVDSVSQKSALVYECQSDDGIASTYQLCLADLDGNPLQTWSVGALIQCRNQSTWASYPLSVQTFVTANDLAVVASMSTYDGVSCVQAFDLHTGETVLSYQAGALTQGMVYGAPLVGANSTIFFLATTNDFQATLTALQGRPAHQGKRLADDEEAGQSTS